MVGVAAGGGGVGDWVGGDRGGGGYVGGEFEVEVRGESQ